MLPLLVTFSLLDLSRFSRFFSAFFPDDKKGSEDPKFSLFSFSSSLILDLRLRPLNKLLKDRLRFPPFSLKALGTDRTFFNFPDFSDFFSSLVAEMEPMKKTSCLSGPSKKSKGERVSKGGISNSSWK